MEDFIEGFGITLNKNLGGVLDEPAVELRAADRTSGPAKQGCCDHAIESRMMNCAAARCNRPRAAGNAVMVAGSGIGRNSALTVRSVLGASAAAAGANVIADPLTVIGSDPLANAWVLEPDFTEGITDFRQSLPEHDFLYLDKAWTHLQRQTAPRIPGDVGSPT